MHNMTFAENLTDEETGTQIAFEAEVSPEHWEVLQPYLLGAARAGTEVVRMDAAGMVSAQTGDSGRSGKAPESDAHVVTDDDTGYQVICRLTSIASQHQLLTTMVGGLRDSAWEAMEPTIRQGLAALAADADFHGLWDDPERLAVADA